MAISVHTEITDANAVSPCGPTSDEEAPSRGWIFYDGECQFCRNWVRRVQPVLGPRGFTFTPLQTPWVRESFRLAEDDLLSEMRVLLRSEQSLGGADAIIEVVKHVWWAWPLVALTQIPGMRRVLRAAYRQISARRSCLGGACSQRPNLSVPRHPRTKEAPRHEIR